MRGAPTSDIWLINVAQGVPNRLTSDSGAQPIFSPTGDRVAFRAESHFVAKTLDGAGEEKPLLEQAGTLLDWSRDGKLLYAAADSLGGSDLWAVALDGERRPVPIATTRFDEGQGQFSPDGSWLAFVSDEADGRHEVYVQSFPAGGKVRITTGGGIYPRWRRDGKELYYIARDEYLMAVPIEISAEGTRVLGAAVRRFQTRLAVGGYALKAGPNARAQYAVGPEGRFLMNVALDVDSPITIVQNWTARFNR
jgi:dipeptidyl aminopeptidase/acylaminoacyl peptidase